MTNTIRQICVRDIKMFVFKTFLQLLTVILINSQLINTDRSPVVRLSQGTLTGTKVYGDSGRVADAFFGIPYAAPPLNSLRFAPPQKHSGWNGTRQASEYSHPCLQLPISDRDSEDCLYLNIWMPENVESLGPLPVVIFFEGIDFAKSNRISIPGQDLAMENVVVVTANYRLNVFGFLCLGIPEARGNLGLLDQYFAILWVRENINLFGGDSGKITLFGHYAGAASIALHMTSSRTAGLFQRAIVVSGSAVSPWSIASDPFAASYKIVKTLNCFNKQPKNVLNCLQNKTALEILSAYKTYSEGGNEELFLPVIDNFLPDNDKYLSSLPENAFKAGTHLQVPILTGLSKPITNPQYDHWENLANQGFSQLQQYFEKIKMAEVIKRYNLNSVNMEQIMQLLEWKFVNSAQGNPRLLLEELKEFEFEAKVEAPHFLQLNYLETSYVQPIYVYYLEDVGIRLNSSDGIITSDLLLLFGPLLLNQIGRRRFTSYELMTSNRIKQIWTNFIKFGNPNSYQNNNWKRYKSDDYYIEYLNSESVNVNEVIITRNRRVAFWTQLLSKMAQDNSNYASSDPKELLLSPDPAASFRHAMYTLVGLVIALLILLLVCIVLLKRRYKERDTHLHMEY